jgi:hypothetical protein
MAKSAMNIGIGVFGIEALESVVCKRRGMGEIMPLTESLADVGRSGATELRNSSHKGPVSMTE